MEVSHPLDFEELAPAAKGLGNARLVNLTVRASDAGQPALFTDTHVLIDVYDVNDFPPVFTRASYSAVVAEDVPHGTFILQVPLPHSFHIFIFKFFTSFFLQYLCYYLLLN